MSWILVYWVLTRGFWVQTGTVEVRSEAECIAKLETVKKQIYQVRAWTTVEGVCRKTI